MNGFDKLIADLNWTTKRTNNLLLEGFSKTEAWRIAENELSARFMREGGRGRL